MPHPPEFLHHLGRALLGETESERFLYEQYVGFVFHLAKRYCPNEDDAADVAQETMITAFDKLANFDPNKGTFKSWIAKIAIHKALRWNAGVKLHLPIEEWAGMEKALQESDGVSEKAREVVAAFSPEQRKLYELFFELGLAHEEIAELLSITVANSRVRVFRLVKELKKKLL